MINLREWTRSGEPWVWVTAAAVSASILLVTGLLTLIILRGVGHFWPLEVKEFTYLGEDGQRTTITGQVRTREDVDAGRLAESGVTVAPGVTSVERILLKTGNRDITGVDFRWILEPQILQEKAPQSMVVLERQEWGVFIGRVLGLKESGELLETTNTWSDFLAMIQRVKDLRGQIRDLERKEIGRLNYQLEGLRLEGRQLEIDGEENPAALERIQVERDALNESYLGMEARLTELNLAMRQDSVLLSVANGQEVELPVGTIIDAWKPNAMNPAQRIGHFFKKFWSFLADDPREANTEGGIYPAIFGTVMMVLLMTVVVAPLA